MMGLCLAVDETYTHGRQADYSIATIMLCNNIAQPKYSVNNSYTFIATLHN